jgi:peroxiredoxin Q/BCP
MITVGNAAPAFSLLADDGSTVALKDLRGSLVVLYFYPADNTPTCTKEACEFRDAFPSLKRSQGVILGVSPDTVASHAKFKRKYELPFTLLADPDHAIADKYGVWGKRKLFGVSYMGVIRTTFVIDAGGIVRHAFTVKRLAGHIDEVNAVLKAL